MRRAAGALAVAVPLLALGPVPARAATGLSVQLLTWGVIGLDSNDVTTGPALFPVGARVCNTGTTTATGLTARFVWDSANAHLSVAGPSAWSLGTLGAGRCRDAYVNVAVARTGAAYLTSRRFHVTATASGISRRTPTRALYVEKLISQNRNQVLGITGPATMTVGETYTIRVDSETAPGGYEQVETFLTLPTSVFRIERVTTTASTGVSPVRQPYLDACGWIADPASSGYLECGGTGKAGGTMSVTYRVTPVATGSGTSTTLVYDFSGSSYHYNTDLGKAPNLYRWRVVAPPPPPSPAPATAPPAPAAQPAAPGTTTQPRAAMPAAPVTVPQAPTTATGTIGVPAAPPQSLPAGPLAQTGADAALMLKVALWLLLGGVLLTASGPCRPATSPSAAARPRPRRRTAGAARRPG
jgi:hypothetical protein